MGTIQRAEAATLAACVSQVEELKKRVDGLGREKAGTAELANSLASHTQVRTWTFLAFLLYYHLPIFWMADARVIVSSLPGSRTLQSIMSRNQHNINSPNIP